VAIIDLRLDFIIGWTYSIMQHRVNADITFFSKDPEDVKLQIIEV